MKRRTTLKAGVAFTGMLATTGLMAAKKNVEKESKIDSFFEIVNKRRSVRKFKPDAIPESDLNKILQAAASAPTSGNQQPWKFLVIKDREKIDGLRDFCIEKSIERYRSGNMPSKEDLEKRQIRAEQYYGDYLSAPVYVIVLTDNNSQYPSYNHYDGPLAAANLILAARSLGYGTVFCTDSINADITKEYFNIPETYTRVCITPIGVPYEWPNSPEKKELDDFIINESF